VPTVADVHDLRSQRRRLAGTYFPTEEERAALKLLQKRWRPTDPLRLRLEQQWITNIAYLIGFQYLTWDPARRTLLYAQTPSLRWRARAIHNLIRPYVELEIGTVGTFTPAFRCRPKNEDPENSEAAMANADLLKHYWSALKMPQKKYELLYLLKVLGNAFAYIGWDSTLGKRVDGGESELGEIDGGAMVKTEDPLFEGDVCASIESPMTVYFDSACSEWQDVRWVIHCRARPREWIEEHFPDKADLVAQGLGDDNGVLNRQRFALDFAGPSAIVGDWQSGATREDWNLVKTYYEKCSRDYPRGRYFVECNGVILDGPRDNPTPEYGIPFIHFRDMMVPGRVWGQCNVDNLLTMQRSLNRFVSKKEEHIVLTANAKVLEHTSNNLPASAWMTEIGEVVKWDGVQAPTYLVPPPMPPETDTEINRLEHHFDLVTSQYGPARGQYPGKLSGKAINVLIEANTQNKTPMIERLASSFEDWGHLLLETLQENVLEPRLVRIVGRAKGATIKAFQGQDIAGNTSVDVEVESMIPKSRTMALDLIQTLTPLGWLQPTRPSDHALVRKALALDDGDLLVEDTRLDLRVAQNENKLLAMGVLPPKANFLEDQDTHMLSHAEWTKSDEFKALPPQVQFLTWQHIQSHIDIAQPRAGSIPPASQPGEETALEPAVTPAAAPMPMAMSPPQPAMAGAY